MSKHAPWTNGSRPFSRDSIFELSSWSLLWVPGSFTIYFEYLSRSSNSDSRILIGLFEVKLSTSLIAVESSETFLSWRIWIWVNSWIFSIEDWYISRFFRDTKLSNADLSTLNNFYSWLNLNLHSFSTFSYFLVGLEILTELSISENWADISTSLAL